MLYIRRPKLFVVVADGFMTVLCWVLFIVGSLTIHRSMVDLDSAARCEIEIEVGKSLGIHRFWPTAGRLT